MKRGRTQWKAASVKELMQLLERPLHGLDLCVTLLDGKGFHDFTLIVVLGVDSGVPAMNNLVSLWANEKWNRYWKPVA